MATNSDRPCPPLAPSGSTPERPATARRCWKRPSGTPTSVLSAPAFQLAELAVAALSRDASGSRRRAESLVGELRRRLQLDVAASQPLALLTRRELEVARLAAHGTRNRDIAAALVVSVRTVESHMATIYRKLGITSRHQLRDLIARSP